MNLVLQNDLENEKFFSELLADETLTEEQRNELVMARLDSLNSAVAKVENMALYISKVEADTEFLKARKKELDARIKAMENGTEWIRNSIINWMKLRGLNEVKGTTYSFKLAKCPASVDIVNESDVPEEFKRTTIETVIEKTKIKEAFKAGNSVPGAVLIEDKMRLSIK